MALTCYFIVHACLNTTPTHPPNYANYVHMAYNNFQYYISPRYDSYVI